MKRLIFFLHSFLSKLFQRVIGIRVGDRFHAFGIPIVIEDKHSKIIIGNDVTIVSSNFGNLLGINHRAILVAREGGQINIGNHVGISGGTIYSLEQITIEDHVNIGANVKIIDHDFHPLEPQARITDDRSKIRKGAIHIGANVFIGTAAIILRGTDIGANCVIGAGSIVKGSFPANCIIAGNPARIIRELTPQELAG